MGKVNWNVIVLYVIEKFYHGFTIYLWQKTSSNDFEKI